MRRFEDNLITAVILLASFWVIYYVFLTVVFFRLETLTERWQ